MVVILRDSKEIIERISECGVQISIQSPPLKTLNPDGSRNNIAQIMLSVAAEFSDMEAKQTKSRMKSGKLQRAIDGRNSGKTQRLVINQMKIKC